MTPSVKSIMGIEGLDSEQANLVKFLLNMEGEKRDTMIDKFNDMPFGLVGAESLRTRLSRDGFHYHGNRILTPGEIIRLIDAVIETSGVEHTRLTHKKRDDGIVVDYCNAGDMYVATVCYLYDERTKSGMWKIAAWCDIIAKCEEKGFGTK